MVEETLADRQELIKAKTIAMDVYGRSMGDDLQTNLVRVDAGRLRRMLDDFYLNEKESSSLRINVPKGLMFQSSKRWCLELHSKKPRP